jgi:hypothetical protein
MSMDLLYVLLGILLTIGIVFLLRWVHLNVKSPAMYAFIWISSILLLFLCWAGLNSDLLFLALILRSLKQVPSWLIYSVLGFGIVFLLRHVLVLIVESLHDLGLEMERTNARITLMENSLGSKLDDISGRLAKADVPPEN